MALNGFALPCVAKTLGSRALEPVSVFSLCSLDLPLDSDRWSSRKFNYKCSRLGGECKLNFRVPLSVRPNGVLVALLGEWAASSL